MVYTFTCQGFFNRVYEDIASTVDVTEWNCFCSAHTQFSFLFLRHRTSRTTAKLTKQLTQKRKKKKNRYDNTFHLLETVKRVIYVDKIFLLATLLQRNYYLVLRSSQSSGESKPRTNIWVLILVDII